MTCTNRVWYTGIPRTSGSPRNSIILPEGYNLYTIKYSTADLYYDATNQTLVGCISVRPRVYESSSI